MPSSCPWTVLLLLLLASSSVLGQSGEHFEDADKSSEYTDQQFDLRHTIPGEPGLDYPILSAPPKTSFVCKGRHEGYYADVESRCQAFRICAHTARTPQGFGFLCPNGTLFSQKNFVCDWYRNVNCDESERYYDMNVDHSVGSTHQMMERVRHMMEYPMKTITKALQQAQSQHHHQHQSLSKDLSSASGVLTHPEEPQIAVVRGEAIKSEPLNAAGLQDIAPSASADDDGEGIYVNSLGELSSDPGIQFDHTNAHIVAEYPREYHYQKQKNFAERVNAGLELQADTESTSSEALAPDYMKHIRSNKDEATQVDLVSNINNLLDEVSSDVDPAVSGYQSMAPTKIKQPFRFLSRGFAMHGDGSKGSSSSAYVYSKPKQTPGTVRFTPNEIPTEDLKSTEHKHKFDKTTSSSTPATTEETPALLIAPTLPTAEEAEGPEEAETTTATTEAASISTSTTITAPLALLEPPLLAPAFAIESLGQAAALTANLPLSDDVAQVEESPEAAEKTSVHQEAAKLLLAGVQLTSHDEETQVLSTNELAESSSTSTTPAMVTSTETVTEISSTQERIRGYRRYAQNRGNSTLRRANVRPLPVVRSTTSTTTQRTTTPTRSYLERLAASRQRLSRLSLATRSTTKAPTTTTAATTEAATRTTASSLSYVRGGAEQGPSKKLSARHIDRETKVETGKASWESVHSSLQRFQVQRGNRIYTPAIRATGSSNGSSTTTSTSAPSTSTTSSFTRPTAAAGSVNRGKNRYSNYKTQAPVTRTRGTTTARVYTTTPSRTTSSPALSTLSQQISALASGYSYAQPAGNSPQTQKHTQTPHTLAYATQTVSDIAPHSSQSITSSLSPASGFLSFDKLTRAIVDDSVLQNFKSVQSKAAPPAQSQSQSQQYRPLTKSNSVGSRGSSRNSISYNKPATAPAISSLTVPQRPPQLPQPALPTPPGIVIVRAEGQRIAPNSAGNIIASLATQAPAKATQGSSYVSLNDFFSSKFGQGNANSVATLQQQQQQQSQVQRQPAQQQHQVQQQQQRQQHVQQVQQQLQRQQQPQQQLNYITQQYQQPQQTIYQPNIYQQQQQQAQFHQQQQQQQQQNPFLKQHQQQFQQQSRPSIQSNQQPYLTPNIFVPYQQQQQQLPQFPPLAPPAPVSATGSVQGSFIGGRHVDHLNVQLPALTNGLIPGLQLAQKRSDVSAHQLQLTDRHPARSGSGKSRERSFYSGRTSYQVPQSSVGRLPNDITQQLRGRLRRY
ncbi:mucin-4 [Drosophila subobscura]|uniref:mucin-4 n=1 Tax=Drosophila subobscura TaxID=7241 RepID=UPI00155AB1B7|nr:mucin-4 [Drosophila subobscura]